MKKILLVLILLFGSVINTCAETKRIISGKESAKITIIAYESLTCSHCANFHKDIYPQLKKEGFDINVDECINNKEIEDFVLNDRIEGTKNFKINATPTIIINNKKFEKSLNYKNLKKLLEKLI